MFRSVLVLFFLSGLIAGCASSGTQESRPTSYDMATLPVYESDSTPEPVEVSTTHLPRKVFTECLSGVVEVAFVIDAEGKAQQIQVLRAEPGDTFIKAAAQAIFATEYEPMKVNGKAVPSKTTRTVEYAKPPGCE